MSSYSLTIKKLIASFGRDEVESWFSSYNLEDFLTSEQISQINKYNVWIKAEQSFLFSLQSNGRVKGMRKFEEKRLSRGFWLYSKYDDGLFGMDTGFYIFKENQKASSYVWEDSSYFDYHGITKAFHPDSTDNSDKNFTPKRFVVIQMN